MDPTVIIVLAPEILHWEHVWRYQGMQLVCLGPKHAHALPHLGPHERLCNGHPGDGGENRHSHVH